jgi:hypothetical protein
MWPNDFRNLFSEYAHCSPEEFEEKIFWRSLHWHAVPMVALLRLIYPPFFKLDFETIERIGQTFDSREFGRDLDRYRFLNGQRHSLLRSLFLVRISGRKLVHLRRRVERTLAERQEVGALQLRPTR